MTKLVYTFLKMFFRNPRGIFFVIFLPSAIFLTLAYLGIAGIIRFNLAVSYNDFLLSGIIALSLMQMGIYTASYSLIDYRRSHILKRLSVTPLSPSRFLLGQTLSRFLIALLQVAVLLLLGWVFFHTTIRGLLYVPILVFFGSTIFLHFGFLIAAVARDYEEAAPYTSIIGLPLLFLGDVFFPVQDLPRGLSILADYLPLKPLASTLRYALLQIPSPHLLQDFIMMVSWLIFTGFLAYFLFAKKVYK